MKSLSQSPTSDVYLLRVDLEEEVGIVVKVKYLPNVKSFRISKLSAHHPVLQESEIYVRMNKPEMEIVKYRNHQVNRYVRHMILRLNRYRSNPIKFFF